MTVLLITHDFSVVQKFSDRIAVMYEGEIVETGNSADIFADPQHDYTKLLMRSDPGGEPSPVDSQAAAIVQTTNLKVWFPIKKGLLKRTVDHVKAVIGRRYRSAKSGSFPRS